MTITDRPDAPTRLYFLSQDVIRRAQGISWLVNRFVSAAYVGLFLGFLDTPRALNMVTGNFYARHGTRWTDGEFNQVGFGPWEREALERYFGAAKSFIVAAAGGGREVLALAARGLRVSAFECAPKFLEYGQAALAAAGVNARLVAAEPDEVPDLGIHDAAIVGWGAYMHIPGAQSRVRFLQRLRAQLVPGAPILVSCEMRKPGAPRARVVATIANAFRFVRGKKAVEVGDQLDGWFCHVFTEDELRDEFEQAGFRLEFCSAKGYGHAVGFAKA
jgi:hypothetical protein